MKIIMKIIICILMGSIILACTSKFDIKGKKDRQYFKEVKKGNLKMEWFYYSSAVSDSPEYIVINKGNEEDTIVVSTNIADIGLENDSIKISFYGKPNKYTKPVKVNLYNYPIKIDTTIIAGEAKYRPTYNKPN
jgi:hypothetical protein